MYRLLSKTLGFTGYVIQYACITHCTFEYLGEFVVCTGPSMEPTLYTNNVLVTERITARMNKVQRGDIVIAHCPTDPKSQVCKRVVGLPGDRIVVKPINSDPAAVVWGADSDKSFASRSLDEEVQSALHEKNAPVMQSAKGEVIVPRGHVWIEGDNAANSADSRYYGPVPLGLINSRAICRIWPINDLKLLI